MGVRVEHANKQYVEVLAYFRADGSLMPFKFRTEDHQSVYIDRVLDVRRAAALKAGGQGIRYTCRICDREVYLFHEQEDYRDWWFIETDG